MKKEKKKKKILPPHADGLIHLDDQLAWRLAEWARDVPPVPLSYLYESGYDHVCGYGHECCHGHGRGHKMEVCEEIWFCLALAVL